MPRKVKRKPQPSLVFAFPDEGIEIDFHHAAFQGGPGRGPLQHVTIGLGEIDTGAPVQTRVELVLTRSDVEELVDILSRHLGWRTTDGRKDPAPNSAANGAADNQTETGPST